MPKTDKQKRRGLG